MKGLRWRMSLPATPACAASPSPEGLNETPYDDLTPELTLDAVEAMGFAVDGRLLALNSYENRVFQLGLDDGGWVVAKFYRPGRWSDAQILEEHALAWELCEAELPIVAPLTLEASGLARVLGPHATLGLFQGHRLSVSPRRGGRAPNLEDPQVLRWLGRLLARWHQVGARQAFSHRETLSVATTGQAARQWLANNEALGIEQASTWLSVCDQALALAQEAFARVPGMRNLRIHGDCHPGNVLWTDEGPHFVDLDDACNGPAMQDLWMLLSGDEQERDVQLGALLDGYETVMPFDHRQLALLEPLRTLRIVHHSAWLARRWHDPAFPAAFPWFGGSAYWAQQSDLLRLQMSLMRESASRM